MMKSVFGCLALLLALAVEGSAQLVAGSPEDSLFQRIRAAGTPAEKIALATEFEQEYTGAPAPVLVSIFSILMTQYEQQNDHRQAVAYGEKIIQKDPGNVTAYMSLCRVLSVNLREDLGKAVEYGERAVSLAQELKAREAPPNYTTEQWETYTNQTETYARSILSYARTVRP
jgi:hypothetical protein